MPEPAESRLMPERELAVKSAIAVETGALGTAPGIAIFDDLLDETNQQRVFAFLRGGGWRFGWRSNAKMDQYVFWHKHFAGHASPSEAPYDCADELHKRAPALYQLWSALEKTLLNGHVLHRCYANGLPFGCEGTIHTDSNSTLDHTSIYYPGVEWHPNWGGETVFFNREETDIVAAVYPKPNRFLMFPATTPHVARGVSRLCPQLRITLMFKTRLKAA